MRPKTITNTYLLVYKVSDIFTGFLTNLDFSQYIFIEVPDTKFHRIPFSGSRAVTCGRTEMVMTIGAFRDSANAPARVSLSYPQKLILRMTERGCYGGKNKVSAA
jgi:hypothetical protein